MPTDNQRDAIVAFYGFEVEDETECQVHALLTYRDYARLAAANLFPRVSGERQLILARGIAAFIGNDATIRADVARWSDRRWRDAADPDTASRGISRTKHFGAIEGFAFDMLADMREAGSGL